MSLIELPLELLHLIGSDLNQKDISRLISTSRRMHSVFQRKLYTNVTLEGQKPNAVPIFFYTVTRNPKLAGYVRSLALAAWDTLYRPEEITKTEERIALYGLDFDGDLIRKLVGETTNYTEEEKLKWLHDLETFVDDAWVALLIPRLTGLRKIGFEFPFGSSHVDRMLKKALEDGGACFPHLEEVNMCWYDTENAVESYKMHPFLRFPSVRKVSGWKVSESDKEDEDEDSVPVEDENDELNPIELLKTVKLPPRCSNVTHIDLSATNAEQGMREWIQACKALKSFRIIHGGATISCSDLQPRKIYDSLSLHKSTLEAFWLGNDDFGGGGENDEEWMGSFVDFSVLKFLRLSLSNLVGYNEQDSPKQNIRDVIPSSLEILVLDVAWGEFCTVLDDLAEIATSAKFPRITFYIEIYHGNSTPETIVKVEGLQQRCQEAGAACYVNFEAERGYMEGIRFTNSLWPQCEAENLNYSC